MQIIRGKIKGAQKTILYGPEGIGKSTLASKFPNPVFIDIEGSTKHMDVARTPTPSSWTMLLEQVKYFKNNPTLFNTVIIDTADWTERMCIDYLCARDKKDGLEGWGYGKGYTYLAEEFGRLLNLLTELIDLDINVVITAHAFMRKFEQPDEMGAYDRWEMKLQRKTAPMVKEWADMVLFCNYKTHVINVDGQGTQKGKNKVQGGKRVIYTTHHPCWDAKNRHDLPDEIPLAYQAIAHCIPARKQTNSAPQQSPIITEPAPAPATAPISEPAPEIPVDMETFNEVATSLGYEVDPPDESIDDNIPKALADLMWSNHVTAQEIQQVVAQRGYYPADTPIANYDPNFINGVLVGAWDQMYSIIQSTREGGN